MKIYILKKLHFQSIPSLSTQHSLFVRFSLRNIKVRNNALSSGIPWKIHSRPSLFICLSPFSNFKIWFANTLDRDHKCHWVPTKNLLDHTSQLSQLDLAWHCRRKKLGKSEEGEREKRKTFIVLDGKGNSVSKSASEYRVRAYLEHVVFWENIFPSCSFH